MLRQFASLARPLHIKTIATFSSDHHHESHHTEDVVLITKHNPLADKDLRGYEHLQGLSQNQKSYSAIHSHVAHPLALYSIFSWFPNSFCRLLGRFVEHPKSQIASDTLYLPRILQNSVPIYDSINKAHVFRTSNRIITQITPVAILALSPHPIMAVLTYGLLAKLYHKARWQLGKDLVIRLELSPQTEEVVYQKLTLFGQIKTLRSKISDLERLSFYDVFGESNLSQRSGRGLYNQEVVFRNKLTKELLLFDKSGIWNSEGINHQLLL